MDNVCSFAVFTGRQAGKALKSPGERFLGLVLKTQGDLQYAFVASTQAVSRLGQSSFANVLVDSEAGNRQEHPLEMKCREISPGGNLRNPQFLLQMFFNVVERLLDSEVIVHRRHSFAR